MTEHSHTETLQASLQVPPPSLGHDMAQLLESGQAADVRFKVEEEELAAHKFILTARSPVFRSCSTMISTLVVAGTTSLILHRLPALWSWFNICCPGSFSSFRASFCTTPPQVDRPCVFKLTHSVLCVQLLSLSICLQCLCADASCCTFGAIT